MTIKEGDEIVYDSEAYTVVKIYSTWDLVQSTALLRSMNGGKLLITAVSLLTREGGERT